MPPKARCCRSAPRCADCPVRAAALARAGKRSSGMAALVEEVFAGRPARPLPEPVVAALAGLDEQRLLAAAPS